ncbi:uncharacterized protein LOC141875947 [Acropora palmata]|uniref:uncharacterized protein LOC141875947 n=1 Tax=Acropora palmata TaxID=6131 RepID=UPI003DA0F62A
MACLWYSLACHNAGTNIYSCETKSWARTLKTGIEGVGVAKRYILSLYWATATATGTGFGDVHAVTLGEKWFSIISMLVGIGLFFGLILGGIASMLTNLDSGRARYIHHVNVIKDHMNDMKISSDVRSRVIAYYEYLWTHNRGVSGIGMFNDLPLSFQAELSLVVNRKVLDKSPLFRGLNRGFKRMLSLVIRQVFYMPNQIIASKGDIGHHMFFIHRGRAEILCEDDKEVLVTLSEGQLFGEVSMVYNLPRSASVRAATPCVVFLLDRRDLNKVLKHYPTVAQQLYLAVERRCNINRLHFDIQSAEDKKRSIVVDMENEEATNWLRETMGLKAESPLTSDSFLRKLTQYVIMPDSWLAVIWEQIVLAVLLIICFVYTFVATFSISLHALGYGENFPMKILLCFTYLLDAVLVADFIMRFNMASVMVTELKSIRKSYKWSLLFWIDLLAILPIEILATVQTNDHTMWHSFSFLRLNRLIKAIRIPRFFTDLENSLNFDIGKVRAVKFTFYIFLVTHVSACVWFLDNCYGETCTATSWAQHIGRSGQVAGFSDYTASLYWAAAAMSSTGYGDIHAHDRDTQLISIAVMLVGLLLYGYCLSSIAATIANSAAPKVQFFAKMTAVHQFMEEQNLSKSIMDRTETYLTILWRVHRGEAIPRVKSLIEDMPLILQQDVSYEQTKDVLEKVPIFMETDENFMRQLSLKAISYIFSPGDCIIYAGDMGREMYCVRRGLVEIIGDDDVTVVGTLGPGAHFGEIGLVFGDNRLSTVKAKTFCEIIMLTKADLDDVLADFPIVARQIFEAGGNEEYLKDVRKAAFESTKAAIRRLSVKCAAEQASFQPRFKASQESVPSKKNNKCGKRQKGRVGPHTRNPVGLTTSEKDLKEDYEKPYHELHPVLKLLSFLLMRHAILPDNSYFRLWQGVSLVVSGILPFSISFQASFVHTSIALWILNYCFDIICLVDMYVRFHLAFYNENNVLVTHPLFTARHYLRTNFLLDLLCSFPTELIVLGISTEDHGVLWILALSRANRCLYIYKLQQFLQYMTEAIGKNTNLIGQIKFAIYMVIFTHCIACGWFLIACEALKDGAHLCGEESWAELDGRTMGKEDVLTQYLTCLYWAAATSASVGYGDIHAHNIPEMGFALFCMVFGIVFYGFIIARVAAGLANADSLRARYQQRLDGIKNFLKEQKISENLTSRIVSYYEYLWHRNKGVDAISLFQGLPLSLQADISFSLYKNLIEAVPLFQGTEIGFLKRLSMKIKPVYLLSKEYVVRKGDMGEEMYFVQHGFVEVVSEHAEPIVFDVMEKGRYFGEISVVFSCPRTASVRAQTNCELFVLTKKDLDEVLTHYPQISKKIRETAEERQRMVAERMKKFAKKKEEDKKREEENKLKEKEEGASPDNEVLESEEPARPIPTFRQRLIATLTAYKTRFGDRFIHFVILPDSNWRFIKYINCLFVFATTLTITYMVAFQDHPWYLITFSYLCELSFYIEIYFNFHMAYRNNVGDLICDGKLLLTHYTKGKLPLDLIASFPVDIFALAAPADKQLLLLSYLRLLHLLRLVRMQQFFFEWGQRLNIDVLRVRLCKFFVQLVIVIHVFACTWFFIACPLNECYGEDSWVTQQELEVAPPLARYSTAVYWAVATMTSTGYGDVHGHNLVEMAFASCVMIFGKLLFGFILGNVASTLANAEIQRVKYEEKLGAIQAYMSDQSIPKSLQNRVMNFYEFIWNKNRGIEHSSLFYDMPLCMNGELCLEMVKDIIYAVPLFEGTELAFVRLLCTKVKPAHFHANEYIVRAGDIGQEMFIIRKGLVEIVTEDDPPEVIETIDQGHFYGEMSLVYTRPHKVSVRAVTHVDMLVLSKEDLDSVLVHYGEIEIHVREVAESLYPASLKNQLN